jgi:hypothetical protein
LEYQITDTQPGLIDTHATEKSGKKRRRIFYGWYMVAASIAANTIFSAAYFQGFGVLIIPIERTFGWDGWVISAAMSLRQLESGIVSPSASSASASPTALSRFFSFSWSFPWEHPA